MKPWNLNELRPLKRRLHWLALPSALGDAKITHVISTGLTQRGRSGMSVPFIHCAPWGSQTNSADPSGGGDAGHFQPQSHRLTLQSHPTQSHFLCSFTSWIFWDSPDFPYSLGLFPALSVPHPLRGLGPLYGPQGNSYWLGKHYLL